MDLRVYYQKIRQTEASITEEHVVVVSCETPDGGRAGVKTETPRAVAAKLVVEGRARLASAEEAAAFREAAAEASRKAEQVANAGKLQLAVLTEPELRALKSTTRPQKG